MKRAALRGAALFWVAQANAESRFGVEAYPAAKADAAVTKSLNKQLRGDKAAAYRTSDSVSKVADFYRKRPLKEESGTSKAMFSGKGVMVTVQNPWMDMDSGKVMQDTLISIVKK